jgi:hypothetical protein
MPTVLEVFGYRFFFYSNENSEPVHVHVEKGSAEAKIWMDPIKEQYAYGFKRGERKEILALVKEYSNVSSIVGMSILKNKDADKVSIKKSSDPFDKLIFEKNIRIKQFVINKELGLIVLLLSNSAVIKVAVKHFPHLKGAIKEELEAAEIRGAGVGLRWPLLDEDISLKGLIKEVAKNDALNRLQFKDNQEVGFI